MSHVPFGITACPLTFPLAFPLAWVFQESWSSPCLAAPYPHPGPCRGCVLLRRAEPLPHLSVLVPCAAGTDPLPVSTGFSAVGLFPSFPGWRPWRGPVSIGAIAYSDSAEEGGLRGRGEAAGSSGIPAKIRETQPGAVLALGTPPSVRAQRARAGCDAAALSSPVVYRRKLACFGALAVFEGKLLVRTSKPIEAIARPDAPLNGMRLRTESNEGVLLMMQLGWQASVGTVPASGCLQHGACL